MNLTYSRHATCQKIKTQNFLFMKNLLPGITLKTIIGCATVSFLISFGTCTFYLYAKANPEKLFSVNDKHFTPHILWDVSAKTHQGRHQVQE